MGLQPEDLLSAARLQPEDLDRLPFGAIVVDRECVIRSYNEYETRLSHLAKERVIGKHFFRDVAPCTAVKAFQGRFQEFFETDAAVSERFTYFFPFPHGGVSVAITFVRLPDGESVLIAVERAANGATA
jgi:photoactive yellow protein